MVRSQKSRFGSIPRIRHLLTRIYHIVIKLLLIYATLRHVFAERSDRQNCTIIPSCLYHD